MDQCQRTIATITRTYWMASITKKGRLSSEVTNLRTTQDLITTLSEVGEYRLGGRKMTVSEKSLDLLHKVIVGGRSKKNKVPAKVISLEHARTKKQVQRSKAAA